MPTSIITNTITNGAGTPVPDVPVKVRLYPIPGFRIDNGVEVTSTVETVTDANGVWSLALEETANITPVGSSYVVDELVPGDPHSYMFVVPATDGNLFDNLVTPIPPAPGTVGLTGPVGPVGPEGPPGPQGDLTTAGHAATDHSSIVGVDSHVITHEAAVDPHPGYLTQSEGDGRYRQTSIALTDADIPTAIARDTEVTSVVTNHVTTDHAGLATDSEVATAVSAHETAGNPHSGYATDGDLTTHAADTTAIHGIADTSVLETQAGAQTKIDTHSTDTTSVHGIADTTVLATDAEVATAITNHEGAANPHTGYATDADLTAHAATSHGTAHPDLAAHDTLGLATQAELSAHNHDISYEDLGTVDTHNNDWTGVHGIADTQALATDAEVATAITNHEAATNPHTGYATDSDLASHTHPDLATDLANHDLDTSNVHGIVDTTVLATDTEVATAVSTHAGAADPHTGYLQETVVSGLATPAVVLGSAAAAGTGTTPIRHNSTIAAFDATAPTTQAFGDAAAVGSVAKAARRDHKHAMPANPVTAHEAAGDPHTAYQKESEKGAANGYASLDSGTLVPVAQIATGTPDGTKFLRDDRTWVVPSGGGVSIPQQDTEPVGSVDDDLWIDTDESAGVGLSSIIGYAEKVTNQTGISAETDLADLVVNVTVPAGRRLRLSALTQVDATVATVEAILRIKEGATQLGLDVQITPPTIAGWTTLRTSTIISPSAGSHTYKVTLQRGAGSGTVSSQAGATYPAYLLVEDITGTLWPAGQSIGTGAIASEAWTSWTPGFVQGVAITQTNNYCRYQKIGRQVTCQFDVTFTSAGTAGQALMMTLPFTPAALGRYAVYGLADYYTAGTKFFLSVDVQPGGTVRFQFLANTNDGNLGGSTPYAGSIAIGTLLTGTLTYEAAA